MAKLTLAQRLDRTAQRRNKVEQEEARLRLIQRKERSRQLIELGALLSRARIDHLSPSALYSCFRRIADEAQDPATVARWEDDGRRQLEPPEIPRTVAVARFPGKPSLELIAGMRRLGFRWNGLLTQWEGRVPFDEAEALVAQAGGSISRVGIESPESVSPDAARRTA